MQTLGWVVVVAAVVAGCWPRHRPNVLLVTIDTLRADRVGCYGFALAQTHYSLLPSTDPGVTATGLDATAPKTVIEITAAGRWRFFGGLEARAEVSALARDGRLEFLPLFGLGASF